MANIYTPQQLGIQAPSGGFQNLGWYNGRQYVNGTFSDPGVIHPQSTQQGAGQAVSPEVNAQSAAAQGKTPQEIQQYLAAETAKNPTPTATANPTNNYSDFGLGGGGATGGGGAGGGAGVGIAPAATIDLPGLYTSLSQGAGITDLENGLTAKGKAFADAQSKINDNPFLSEATRVGRIQKLTTDYNADVKNDQDTLAMKKADVQTQLDLQTKQFDINSQSAKQSLDQFNTLLSSGALDNASGTDIANLTRSTGLSSSAIQSAIAATKQKNANISIHPYDDGKNQGFVTIDANGNIINRSVVGPSKPTASSLGGNPGSSEYNSGLISGASKDITSHLNSYGNVDPATYQKVKAAFLAGGGTAADFNANFGGYADSNRADFDSAYGFKNPTPVWSTAYPGNKIGTVITDNKGNKITITK